MKIAIRSKTINLKESLNFAYPENILLNKIAAKIKILFPNANQHLPFNYINYKIQALLFILWNQNVSQPA